MAPSAGSNFTFDEALSPWNVPEKDYLIKHNKQSEWNGLATASVVFNPDGKILLIQRAATDSMPNRWELPGGAVDADDPTILHGAARELFEESGLVAKRFTHLVAEGQGQHFDQGQIFPNSTKTKIWCRFTFHADVEIYDDVKLDPNEHQDFAWASEEEVREGKLGDRPMQITKEAVTTLILKAFRLRRDREASH